MIVRGNDYVIKKGLHKTHHVGGLEHFLFSHILGIIIPID